MGTAQAFLKLLRLAKTNCFIADSSEN